MLDLIPTSWFTGAGYCLQSRPEYGGPSRQDFFLLVRIPSNKRPYQFGFKPKASRKNLTGNRRVNHLQLHGSLLYGPDVESDPTGQHQGYYRGHGCNLVFDYVVPDIHRSFKQVSYIASWSKPDKNQYERCINRVEYFLDGWYWINFRYSDGFVWENVQSGRKYNILYDFQQVTDMNGTQQLSKLRYCRPSRTWKYLNQDVSVDDAFAIAVETCRQYILSTPLEVSFSGNGYSEYYHFLANHPKFGFKSSELTSIKADLLAYARRVEPLIEDLDDDLGKATQDAVNSVRYFDGNTAVYLKELFELKDSILSLIKLLKGNVSAKSLADLYVSNKYGLRLTALDTIDLYNSIVRKTKERSPGVFSVSRGSGDYSHCKLYYDPTTRNGLAKVSETLFEWDLFPTLTNVWDIVPYSFVVDWFVDVEGFLDAIDTRTQLSVLNVIGALYSYKHQWQVSLPRSVPFVGTFQASRFHRFFLKEPVEPRPTFSGSLPSVNNVVTGSALIIQRL